MQGTPQELDLANWDEWEQVDPLQLQGGETVALTKPAALDVYNQNHWGVYHNRTSGRPTAHDGAFARILGTETVMRGKRRKTKFKESELYLEGFNDLPDEEVNQYIREGFFGRTILWGDTVDDAVINEWREEEEEEPTKTLLAATGHDRALMCVKDRVQEGEIFMKSGRHGLIWENAAPEFISESYNTPRLGPSLIRFKADGCPDPSAIERDTPYAILVHDLAKQVVFQSYYGARAYRRYARQVPVTVSENLS